MTGYSMNIFLFLVKDKKVVAKLSFNTASEIESALALLIWPELEDLLVLGEYSANFKDGEHTVYTGSTELDVINKILSDLT